MITGYVSVFINHILHPDMGTFTAAYIPIELIKFIGNSLGIETVRIIKLDQNIHLKE